MVSAIAVANEFIRLGKEDNKYFTPMQILKLVYIAHGWMLGFFGRSLIDEHVEAWKYGPVIPELYQAVKKYGRYEIPEAVGSRFRFPSQPLNEEEKSVINFVYKKYGHIDGIQLSMITHQLKTPWSLIFSHEGWGDVIPNEVIQAHYTQLSNEVLSE